MCGLTRTPPTPTQMESLRRYIAAWPEVDLVQVDSDWVQRLNAILDLLRGVVLGAAVLLGVGVLAVIGNTIRLEIFNRRAEIEVTKLVGGSNAFVRRPFLYTGLLLWPGRRAWLATLLVLLGLQLLNGPVTRLAQSYGSAFRLLSPGLAGSGRAARHRRRAWGCWARALPRRGTWPGSNRGPDSNCLFINRLILRSSRGTDRRC